MMRWLWPLLLLTLFAADASAQWDRVKVFVNDQAEIIEETEERLVIVRDDDGEQIQLVLTSRPEPDSDIYGDYALRRAGNPYRIWVITERLDEDETRPRRRWGRLLQAEFLRILRPPRDKMVAR